MAWPAEHMRRIGKKRAGRHLDGRTWEDDARMTKINGHPATPAAILGIWGHEPKREGEYPTVYMVGAPCGTFGNEATLTSRIAYREVNYGDHALGFFDVFVEVDGEERQIVSMAARAVAEIHYEPPG